MPLLGGSGHCLFGFLVKQEGGGGVSRRVVHPEKCMMVLKLVVTRLGEGLLRSLCFLEIESGTALRNA